MRISDWSSDVCSSDLRRDPVLDHRAGPRARGAFDAQIEMITCSAWRGRRYAVLGLARSGPASVRALLAAGAEVVAWDSDAVRREGRAGEGFGIGDLETIELAGVDALVGLPALGRASGGERGCQN